MGELINFHDDELLPPEYLLDEYHPANDEFIKNIKQLEREIMMLANTLKPAHVAMIKLCVTGVPTKDIAKQHSVTPTTVSRVINTPVAKKIKALLAHHTLAMDGPNVSQRVRMLWEIAKDNQKKQPRTAIAALETINKMTIAEYELSRQSGGNTIEITINANELPRTVLDG